MEKQNTHHFGPELNCNKINQALGPMHMPAGASAGMRLTGEIGRRIGGGRRCRRRRIRHLVVFARYGMGGVEVRDFETVNADSISSAVDVEREVFVRPTDDGKWTVIGSRQKINALNENHLDVHIRTTPIECVSQYKCLGVIVDSNLLFTKHVEKVALQMKQKLGILRRLKSTFNKRYLSMIYWGYILPHAMYCCTVWTNRSQLNYETINQLHKRAAYIISGCSWSTPSQQVLIQLNWSTLEALYSRALACMTFKCVHHLAPALLANKFILHDDVAQRTTRNSHQLKLESYKCNTEFYKRSFVNLAISHWNNLPVETRFSPNLNMFKSNLSR